VFQKQLIPLKDFVLQEVKKSLIRLPVRTWKGLIKLPAALLPASILYSRKSSSYPFLKFHSMTRSVFYFVCGTWLFIDEVNGQYKKIVEQELENKGEGEEYLALYELAVDYIDKDNGMALELIQKAEHAAMLSGNSLGVVKTTRTKGQIFVRSGRFDDLISTLQPVSFIAKRQKISK